MTNVKLFVKTYGNTPVGTITWSGVAGDRLTGSTPALQELADAITERESGDQARAVSALDGWQNGYVFASSDSSAVAATTHS